MTLSPEQTQRVEWGLALVALSMHHRAPAREQASGAALSIHQVCAMDQADWPCPYAQWALDRVHPKPPPPAANDRFGPRFQAGTGHCTGNGRPPQARPVTDQAD